MRDLDKIFGAFASARTQRIDYRFGFLFAVDAMVCSDFIGTGARDVELPGVNADSEFRCDGWQAARFVAALCGFRFAGRCKHWLCSLADAIGVAVHGCNLGSYFCFASR